MATTAIVLKSKSEIETCLTEAMQDVAALLPRSFAPERMVKIFVQATDKNPELLKCSKQSWVIALTDAAESCLEPVGFTGEAALIPYGGQVQFQPMYKGLCKKVRECAGVKDIHADTVCEGDEFEFYHAIPEDHFFHRPALMGRGEIIGAWARAILSDGRPKIVFYDKREIERCRKVSKAPNGPMWGQHYGEAAKKSVIKALCKTLSMTPQLAKIIEIDNRVEADLANQPQVQALPMPRRRSEIVAAQATPPASPQTEAVDYSKDTPPPCPKCGGETTFIRGKGDPTLGGYEPYWKCNSKPKNCKDRGVKGANVNAAQHHAQGLPVVVSATFHHGHGGFDTETPSPSSGSPSIQEQGDRFTDRIVATADGKKVSFEALEKYARSGNAGDAEIEKRLRQVQDMQPKDLKVLLAKTEYPGVVP